MIKKIPSKTKILARHVKKIDDHTISVQNEVQHTYVAKLQKFNKLGEFYFIPLDPVDILIQNIESSIKKISDLEKEFQDIYKETTRKLLNPEEDAVLDSLIMNSISMPVMICCALEAFVNQRIFRGLSYTNTNLQFEVQRHVPIRKKIFKILPELAYNKDFFINSSFKSSYEKVTRMRNAVVHQKTITKEGEETVELIRELLDTNWTSVMKDVKKIVYELDWLHSSDIWFQEKVDPKVKNKN